MPEMKTRLRSSGVPQIRSPDASENLAGWVSRAELHDALAGIGQTRHCGNRLPAMSHCTPPSLPSTNKLSSRRASYGLRSHRAKSTCIRVVLHGSAKASSTVL